MILKRVPVIPTLLVLAAVAVMVRLGFWQLDRMHQKDTMLAQFETALADPPDGFDMNRDQLFDYPDPYAPVRVLCDHGGVDRPKAGRNDQGKPGWVHIFQCTFHTPAGRSGHVNVTGGWSSAPSPVQWSGGAITGLVVPESMTNRQQWHILADPPLAGLQANARPDLSNIPNNHWSYAIQWFLFAATALVIYGLALRKRRRGA